MHDLPEGLLPVRQMKRVFLDSSFTDFEDALQYFSALAVDADVIVTRNEDDFEHSEIPVYNPSQFLALMEGEQNK